MSISCFDHPEFCGTVVCADDPGGDIVHREAPSDIYRPASDPDRPLTFGLGRVDEVDDRGDQVVHPVEGVVTYPAGAVWYTAAELRELASRHTALALRVEAYEQARAIPRAG